MESNKIRNIAIIGHSGEGKTTLCEAILFNCGVIDRQGKVEDGNTVMDFDAESPYPFDISATAPYLLEVL